MVGSDWILLESRGRAGGATNLAGQNIMFCLVPFLLVPFLLVRK